MSKKVTISQNKTWKALRSESLNYNFNKETGYLQRWGVTFDDDPAFAPFPEILDIEITSICNGPNNRLCKFCYKGNTPKGHNMTLSEFKTIIDKMPFLTQMALGADAHGTTNPDMFDMMAYARSKNIIPNITLSDISEEVSEKLAVVAGAVAISVYKHAGFEIAYRSAENVIRSSAKQNKIALDNEGKIIGRCEFIENANLHKISTTKSLQELMDENPEQAHNLYKRFGITVNFHYMISAETIKDAWTLMEDMKTNPTLKYVNAVVFLSLKQKRRGKNNNYVNQDQYNELVQSLMEKNVPFGFDSCSAPSFIESVKDHKDFDKYRTLTEDCEATLHSSYINEYGEFFPCSFTEGWVEGAWETGLDVLNCNDFIKDIWFHPRTKQFREALLSNTDDLGCRNCPAFSVCGIEKQMHMKNGKYENISPCSKVQNEIDVVLIDPLK